MKYLFQTILAASAVMLSSCEKVIDLNLKSVEPQIVIEGNIWAGEGPYEVKLTKTVNYNESNTFPVVSGAEVVISDNAGQMEVLVEGPAGIYKTQTITGIPERNYFLSVKAENITYRATSYMPAPVTIDSIVVNTLPFGGSNSIYLQVKFMDRLGEQNFYRLIEVVNGVKINNIRVSSDENNDGNEMSMAAFGSSENRLKSGDKVELQVHAIDRQNFQYLLELAEISGGGGNLTAPANPTTNLDNKALGYFNAYAEASMTIVIP